MSITKIESKKKKKKKLKSEEAKKFVRGEGVNCTWWDLDPFKTITLFATILFVYHFYIDSQFFLYYSISATLKLWQIFEKKMLWS